MVSIKRNSKGEFAEAKGLRVRKSSIYEPGQQEVFKISRSKFSNFMDCERCFYLDRVKGIARTQRYAYLIDDPVNQAIDKKSDLLDKLVKAS